MRKDNKIWGVVLLFMTVMAQAQTGETDAANYFSNQSFGWATCSDVNGKSYIVDGGSRVENPKTIVLYCSGEDDRSVITNAIANNDIIILDGSKGDFVISKSISIYNLSNKTIVGRNNARICTKWYITPELKQILEDANLGQYSSSSGTGGTLSNGREVDEEREWHTRQTIIDYSGDATEAYRNSGIFQMNTTNENIIIRNLKLVGPGSVDVGGYDLVSNYGATHVWIDHCEFIDGMDGNLDSGKREGSEQFVTYSWNIFRYTDRSYSHPYSNGTGWNKGYLQYVTYAYNIWGAGCKNRLPQADWVYMHLVNNYYNCVGNSVAIAINANSHALIEGNYADSGVNNPFKAGNYSDLYYLARNNYGFGNNNNKSNTSISLEVPYEYSVIPVENLPTVLQGTHGAGATIDDLIDEFLNPDKILTAPSAYYSRRMVESQGKAWSADKSWDYVSGLVTKSLLKCTTQYPEDEWSQTAYDWCKYYADAALNEDGSFRNFKKGNIDNIASGKVFFELYHHELAKDTDEGRANAAKYKTAVDYLYNYLRNDYSRIQLEDGQGGFYHKDIYPNQMWLDGLYMGAAFYAEYLANFAPEDMEGWSDVANQFMTIHRHTYDPEKKLNYHGWSADPEDENSFWANDDGAFKGCSSEFWGRGMGWYFAALTDVLDLMPIEHPNYSDLKNILSQVAEGLKQWQDETSGVWYQLLQYDDTFVGECGKSNYLEASASCMFTYSYLKALRLGLIDESYRIVAEKAYRGVLNTFISENSDETLNINFSCKSAGLGPKKSPQRDGSASYYLCGSDVTVVSNEGKSIGPFIMASLEWELLNPETNEQPDEPEAPIEVTGITLNETSIELAEWETFALQATVEPENVTEKIVTWSTSDATIATVDEDGVVTAISAGEATITATVAEFMATCIVKVKAVLFPEYKIFTENRILLTTVENIQALKDENWIRGGESFSSKAGTIDPLTGETVDKYSGGGIMLKKGNDKKMFETYVTGVSSVTAYACTAGGTDRTLIVSATSTNGESISAKGVSSNYKSVDVTLALDETQNYQIQYIGTLAENEESGADMVLHGVRFTVPEEESFISNVNKDENFRVDVYSLQGVLLKRQIMPQDLEPILPSGVYLIGGRKLFVK